MVWLDRKNDEIMDRINLRTQSMIDGGMIEEAEQAIRLCDILRHPSLSQSVGYREIIKFIKEGGPRKVRFLRLLKSTHLAGYDKESGFVNISPQIPVCR